MNGRKTSRHLENVWALLCSKIQLKAKELILTIWVGKQETVFKWDAYLYNNSENQQAETFEKLWM